MPFELSNSFKKSCNWSFASNGMNKLFRNKIYTSLILTVIIIIILMIMYPCKENTPVWKLLKIGFYIFLAGLGVIFLHDCVLFSEYEKKSNDDITENIISDLNEPNVAFGGDTIKVSPIITNSHNIPEVETSNQSGGNSSDIFELYGV
jgi:hypothetical protein